MYLNWFKMNVALSYCGTISDVKSAWIGVDTKLAVGFLLISIAICKSSAEKFMSANQEN